VDQDERAAAPLSGQICPDHRLAHAGRGNENTVLIGEKRPGRRVLNARQFSAEGELKGFSTHPLVLHVEGDSVLAQQRLRPLGRPTYPARSSAQEITRGVTAVERRMLCRL